MLGVAVKFCTNANAITSAGIEISGVKSTLVSARKKHLEPIILHSSFVANFSKKVAGQLLPTYLIFVLFSSSILM